MPASQQKLINFDIAHVDVEEVRQAAEFQVAILTDMTGYRGILHGRIRPLAPYMAVAGPATTIGVHPGDNLAIHAAVAVTRLGDALVIDGKGDLSYALLGEIMATQAQVNGITGVVIDGATRDVETLGNQRFPVFAAGLNPYGPTKFIPGRVNHVISVGGTATQASDLVVRDIDGVAVISRDEVRTIIELAKGGLVMESERLIAIHDGDLRPHWLESALRQAGMLSEEEALPWTLKTSS